MRLFIADDSEVLRSRIVEAFSDIDGVEIIGQEGEVKKIIKDIMRLKPDVVVLDIRMPGGNGISVLKIIKNLENSPVVIMFTNFPSLQYRKICADLGADFFFYKATEFEKLIKLIKSFIHTKNSK